MKNLHFIFIMFSLIIATSCAPSSERVAAAIAETQAKWTDVPTQTPYPTYTPLPSLTPLPIVVITKIVTITPSNTSENTATTTNTPTKTATITNTPRPSRTPTLIPNENPMTADHHNGTYGVGIDIAPGQWEVTEPHYINSQPDCYWARYNAIGNVIEDDYGATPPFVIMVYPTDILVEFDGCGKVTYLGQ